jgi:hypothetical protein
MDRFTRWTLIAVAIIVVVAVWTATRPSEISPPVGTEAPVAVTRAWFTAFANGRPEDAWELLAPEAQSRESRAEFLRRHPAIVSARPGATRMRIETASVTGDEARVDVARSYGSSSDFPFWRSTVATDRVVVRLRLVDGQWRVTDAPDYP